MTRERLTILARAAYPASPHGPALRAYAATLEAYASTLRADGAPRSDAREMEARAKECRDMAGVEA